ncbi:MAG: LysR family transcriptional regulator [Firmicutes bacterium]|nr:LysR family transcriptional regulator [Bacillota bacterium]
MDIRIMQYFLTLTQQGTISAAAEALHVSQPSLSRQMKELEEELGVRLFLRGKRQITLTPEGLLLKNRAAEMLHLMRETEKELTRTKGVLKGDLYIGSGETHAFRHIAALLRKMREAHPEVRFHLIDGDTEDLLPLLDAGKLDFAVLFTNFEMSAYHTRELPETDRFGILMRDDAPLAAKEALTVADLYDQPLIISRASEEFFFNNEDRGRIHIIGTYNQVGNTAIMVAEGVGYALVFDRLLNLEGTELCIRPLLPVIHNTGRLVWRKYQVYSPVMQAFLELLAETPDNTL